MFSTSQVSLILLLLRGKVQAEYNEENPRVEVELLYSRDYTLNQQWNGQRRWVEIKQREPIYFYDEKTIFWQLQDPNRPLQEPLRVQIKLTCMAPYLTKWIVNSEYQNTVEPGAAIMNYNVKLLPRDGEDPFVQNQANGRSFNVTELTIDSFGDLFQSGTVDCVKYSDPSVKSQLYIFQRYDEIYKPFKDSLGSGPMKLALSQDAVIPCKVHDPDLTPQLHLLRNTKYYVVTNHDYNFNVGFKREVGNFRMYMLHDTFICSFRDTDRRDYTFVSDSEITTSKGDENNISIGHKNVNKTLVFTCKSVGLSGNIDFFTPQSMKLQYCKSPGYCDWGSSQHNKTCPSQSMKDCRIKLSLSVGSWLNRNGQISCTSIINDKIYRKTMSYFVGLRNNYYLLQSDQSVPPEEVIELEVQQFVNANAITVVTVTCKALPFLTFPSMKIFVNYADASRLIPLASGEPKIYTYYMIAENVQITLTDQMRSISCHVPLYNSTEWLVAYHHFNWPETTPSTPTSPLPVPTTILPSTSTTTVITSSRQTAASSLPSTTVTTMATTTTKATPPSTTTTRTTTTQTTTTTTTTTSTTKETTTTTPRSKVTPSVKPPRPVPKTATTTTTATSVDVDGDSSARQSPIDGDLINILIIAGGCFLLILLIGCCIHHYCIIEFCCCPPKPTQKSDTYAMKAITPSKWVLPPKYKLKKSDISIDDDKLISTGQFSTLYHGFLKQASNPKTPIYVKVNKIARDPMELSMLLNDARMRLLLGDDHHNIAGILGVYNNGKGKVHIVMPAETARSIRDYLTNKQMHADRQKLMNMPPENRIKFLVSWLKGISCGMEFLHSKQIIHANLASENVLSFPNNMVQLTGFSHSQQLAGTSAYFKISRKWTSGWEFCGWRWMPSESLRYMEFSKESDLWSFGVVMWEIFSLGALPYTSMGYNAFSMEFIQKLEFGIRLGQPNWAPKNVYKKMEECWSPYGKDRPSFCELNRFFNDILLGGQLNGPLGHRQSTFSV